jgi:hypothetical protein
MKARLMGLMLAIIAGLALTGTLMLSTWGSTARAQPTTLPPPVQQESGGVAAQASSSNVELVAQVSGYATAVATQEYYAYYGQGYGSESRLVILGFSETGVVEVGRTDPLPGTIQNIAVSGDYVYVAGHSGLHVISALDKSNPYKVGSYAVVGDTADVAVCGNYICVVGTSGAYKAWLRVLSVADKSNPREIGYYETAGGAQTLAVEGNYAYIGGNSWYPDWDDWLRIISLSDPSNPREVGFYDLPGFGSSYVAVADDYLYSSSGGLNVISVSDPANPWRESFHSTPGYLGPLAASQDYVYMVGYYGLKIVSVADKANPQPAGFFNLDAQAQDVAVADKYLYVADGNEGLFILWFSPPVEAFIPMTGGSLTSLADNTTYFFPSDTFTDTVVVTHTARFPGNAPSSGNLVGISHVFSATAVYSNMGQLAQPTRPYTITVGYTDTEKGPAIENTLALYHWDESQWVKEPSSVVDPDANTVTAMLDHFSLWAVLGETRRVFLPVVLRNY